LPDPHPWAKPYLLKQVVDVSPLAGTPGCALAIILHSVILVPHPDLARMSVFLGAGVASRSQATGQRYVGILTNGATAWH
jgi:hypothetical protein